MNERRLPGGPIYERSYAEGADGIWRDTEGEPVDKDIVYTDAFWKLKKEQLGSGKHLEDFERIMREGITEAAAKGTIGNLMNNLDEESKMKLSAIRVLARSMGYEVGQFKFNERSGVATATIKKIS